MKNLKELRKKARATLRVPNEQVELLDLYLKLAYEIGGRDQLIKSTKQLETIWEK